MNLLLKKVPLEILLISNKGAAMNFICLGYFSPDGHTRYSWLCVWGKGGEKVTEKHLHFLSCQDLCGESWCLITAECSLDSRTQPNYQNICQRLLQ